MGWSRGWGKSKRTARIMRRRRPVNPQAGRGALAEPLEGRLLLARILYVDWQDPNGEATNDGTSWQSAYVGLQAALTVAVSGDEIRVADGTYKPTTPSGRSATFSLKNGVGIYGGYAGYDSPDPDARDIVAYPSILSGDIGATGTNSDNCYHVVTGNGTNNTAILDGFTITAGYANGSYSEYYGGGMYNYYSAPTVANCTFSGNSASSHGGGMYNYHSSPTLTSCTFSGNAASSYGGGMYNDYKSPTLTNCTFSGNSAVRGGGMYNSGISPTLTNCTFSGNAASKYGGGMYNFSYSSPTLTNCTFSGNSASSGGGVDNTDSSPKLTNCTFSGNSASSYYGCAMLNSSSSPTLTNCTFSGNAAADGRGGAVYSISSTPTLINCILWSTLPQAQIYGQTSTPIVRYSNVQGGYAGTGNINANPYFVRNPSSGPDGTWGTADDDYGDLRLQPGSPALDIGSNAAIPAGITTDLAGSARIQDGTVDLGAYEGPVAVVPAKIIFVDLNAVGAGTGTSWIDAFTSLQSALLAAVTGDTIRIADGTYRPTSTTDRTMTFTMKNAVAIRGGYAGYGAADPDARDMVAFPTVLSGDIGVAGDSSDNTYNVVTAYEVYGSSVLDGVSVTLGNANGTAGSGKDMGGGICCRDSSPTLTNCTFSGNSASQGGGMYNSGISPTLTNCTFSGNSASQGGGMYNSGISPTLTNCTFSGNPATQGGGMYNSIAGSPRLTNCTFSGNSAFDVGGGMYNRSETPPKLTNCIFWGNKKPNFYNDYMGLALAVSYSNIQGGYAGTGNINADPRFVRNPSPGPDGKWATADDDYGDLRLSLTSPCIDIGDNTAPLLAGVTGDRAGSPRFSDIPGVVDKGNGTAPIVDMGAYEAQVMPLVLAGSGDDDCLYLRLSPDGTNLQAWLGSAPAGEPDSSYLLANVPSFTFDAGNGVDSLFLDFANGSPIPSGGLNFSAGGGADRLALLNTGPTAQLAVAAGQVSYGAGVVACPNTESILLGGSGDVRLGSLSLGQDARLSLAAAGDRTLFANALSLAPTALLDLNDNALVVETADALAAGAMLATLEACIASARNGSEMGSWDGPAGITSGVARSQFLAGNTSKGLGLLWNDKGDGTHSRFHESVGGVPVSSNAILVRYVWCGDINLDGLVDIDDYTLIDNGFLATVLTPEAATYRYQDGDLNYDGLIDIDDYTLIDNGFLGSLGGGESVADTGTSAGAVVPLAVGESVPAAPLFSRTPIAREPACDDGPLASSRRSEGWLFAESTEDLYSL